MLRRVVTLALAAALVVPGSALARHAPLDDVAGTPAAATTSQPVNFLRDAKYLPQPTAAAQRVQVVRIVEPAGFDFRDAGVGAAAAAIALVGLGAVALGVSRSRGGGHGVGSVARS